MIRAMDGVKVQAVLTPLDGSPLSEHALPLAVACARGLGVPLRLLHAPHVHAARWPDGAGRAPKKSAGAAERARLYLEATRSALAADTDAGVEMGVLEGTPARAIVEAIDATPGALVVMASHGREGLTRALFGSVAEKVLHATHAPIVLVPARVDPPPEAVRNVLLALDGSPQAERIVPAALALTRALGAHIVLAHVVPDARTLSPGAPEEAAPLQASYRRWLDVYLDEWRSRLADEGIDADVQTIEHEDVAEGLRVCASAHPASLVAITTHGRGGVAHWPFGSVAHRLIRTANVPMLLLRVTEG